MTKQITFSNKGQDIVSSNYWGSNAKVDPVAKTVDIIPGEEPVSELAGRSAFLRLAS